MKKNIAKTITILIMITVATLTTCRIELLKFNNTQISSLKLNVAIYGMFLAVTLISYLIFRLKNLEENKSNNK